jgi:hypothetical protein
MDFVYFSDARDVVHKVPCDLTHFEPNSSNEPYELKTLSVKYASGSIMDVDVDHKYFDTLADYIDPSEPTFPKSSHKGLYMGEFVRMMGSRKAVTALVNYFVYSGAGLEDMLMKKFGATYTGMGLVFKYNLGPREPTVPLFSVIKAGFGPIDRIIDCSIRTVFGLTIVGIVDVCMNLRETIDFVRTSTNEMYARSLSDQANKIRKVLQEVNPARHLEAMRWLAPDMRKIPQEVLLTWIEEQ